MAKINLVILGASAAFVTLGKGVARCSKAAPKATRVTEKFVNKSTIETEKLVNESAQRVDSKAAVYGARAIERSQRRAGKQQTTGTTCYRCDGMGRIFVLGQDNAWRHYACPVCGGTGKIK